MKKIWWAADPFLRLRRLCREVGVGVEYIGNGRPLLIQSMCTADTLDTLACVEQIEKLVKAGCLLARLTAPTVKHAANLSEIKKELLKKEINVPLCADIHFHPEAALEAALHVEKIRINPGNYASAGNFRRKNQNQSTYLAESQRLKEKFKPLVKLLKQKKRALRIGVNHGSLAARMLDKFGDTPLGMVESALEFIEFCQAEDYHDLVVSLKASNPRVMITAYRLLAMRMKKSEFNYPLHLGVTEAGEGEDGRIKSAAGIGALLADGLGDTIRVSLTEEPQAEIPVAQKLAQVWELSSRTDPATLKEAGLWRKYWYDCDPLKGFERPLVYENVCQQIKIGGAQKPLVVSAKSSLPVHKYQADLWWQGADAGIFLCELGPREICLDPIKWLEEKSKLAGEDKICWISLRDNSLKRQFEWIKQAAPVLGDNPGFWISQGPGLGLEPVAKNRLLASWLKELNLGTFLLLELESKKEFSHLEKMLWASGVVSALLADNVGNGIILDQGLSSSDVELCFSILQAMRFRMSRADFISCPGCGRTLFDLNKVTVQLKKSLGHLTGVKIAIMGCVVNGPGEMADADFGIIGGAAGKVSLYFGKTCIKKNIPLEKANEELIILIKSKNLWREP
jgi:(E)-4-hydroxy-3-methylbut-2-enyl-diphosphate synthase